MMEAIDEDIKALRQIFDSSGANFITNIIDKIKILQVNRGKTDQYFDMKKYFEDLSGEIHSLIKQNFIVKIKEINGKYKTFRESFIDSPETAHYNNTFMKPFKKKLDELIKKYIVDTTQFISYLTDSLKRSLKQSEIETTKFIESLKNALQQSMTGDKIDSSKFVGLFSTALENSIKYNSISPIQTTGFVDSLATSIQSSLTTNKITTTDFVSSLTTALSSSIDKISKGSNDSTAFVHSLTTAINDSFNSKVINTANFVGLLTKQIEGSLSGDKINTSKFVISLTNGIQNAIKGQEIKTDGFVKMLTESVQSAIKAKEIDTIGFVSTLTTAIKGSIGTKKIDTTAFVNNLQTAIQSSISSKKIDTIPFVTSLTNQLNSAINGRIIDTADFVRSLTIALQKSISTKPINTTGFVDSLTRALTNSIRTKQIDTTIFVTSLTGALQNSIKKKEIDTKQFVSNLANGIQTVIQKANLSLLSRVRSGIGKFFDGKATRADKPVVINSVKEIKQNTNSINVNGRLSGFKDSENLEINGRLYSIGDKVIIKGDKKDSEYTIRGFKKVGWFGGRKTMKKRTIKGGLLSSKVEILLDRAVERPFNNGTDITIIPKNSRTINIPERRNIPERGNISIRRNITGTRLTENNLNRNNKQYQKEYFRLREQNSSGNSYYDDTESNLSDLTDRTYSDRQTRGNLTQSGVNKNGSIVQIPTDVSLRLNKQDEKIQFLQEQIDSLKGISASPSSTINPQQISDTIQNINKFLKETNDIEIHIDGCSSEYYDRYGNLISSSTKSKTNSETNSKTNCGPNSVPEIQSILDMSDNDIIVFIDDFIDKIKGEKVTNKIIEVFTILLSKIKNIKPSKEFDILAKIIKQILEKILGNDDGNKRIDINSLTPDSTKEFVDELTAYLQETLDISKSFPDKLADKLAEVFRRYETRDV